MFDINKWTVLAARSSDDGETTVAKMFAFMGLPPPPPTQKSWNRQPSGMCFCKRFISVRMRLPIYEFTFLGWGRAVAYNTSPRFAYI